MKIGVGLCILLIVTGIILIIAIFLSIRLIKRTKYNIVWILCIIGFITFLAEHICQIIFLSGGRIAGETFLYMGAFTSVSIAAAVIFAHTLINYIDRMEHQRTLFNKRIMTAALRAEERSRSKFAKELHDGLGPLLSSAKMSLSALDKKNLSSEQQSIIQNTSYVIAEAISSVREISANMSPQILMDFGIMQGIRSFIKKVEPLHDIEIRFDTNLGSERFDNDIEVILYRVICELINNSIKHAKCDRILINIKYEASMLKLRYSDNGRGFNPKAMIDCGMGLSNISSRINSINGIFEIQSNEGQGMKASIEIKAVKL
ncbi:MAG: sensor histidine kinase [Alistipes sp.]|nr:sensor histidine kinase [Candidatus Alistipes equi]